MPIKLGSTNISKVFLGTNPVNKAYLGSTLLFDATPAPQIPKYWRYVRYIGHGDQTGVTSRLVEFQALQGATNRLLGKLPISGTSACSWKYSCSYRRGDCSCFGLPVVVVW